MPLKRFLLFAGHDEYPNGGWEDFKGSYDTLSETFLAANDPEHDYDWAHYVDIQAGSVNGSRLGASAMFLVSDT